MTFLEECARTFESILTRPCTCTQFVEPRIGDETFGHCFETALVRLDGDGRESGEFFGPFECIGEGSQPVHTTLCVQLLGRIHAGTEQHVPRHGPSEFVTRTLDRPLIDGETQLRGRNSESTRCRGHAQIAGECELCSGTHRRSVDRSQRDARQSGEAAQRRTERIGEIIALDTRQVGTRTEGGRLTRQDDDARSAGNCLLVGHHRLQRLEVDRVAPVWPSNRDHGNVRALPIEGDRTDACSAGTFFHIHPYHLLDCMTSGNPSPSLPVDPVRERRAQVAKYTLLANRIGYLLYAATIACFVFAFALGFNSTMVGIMTFGLVAGSILLAPSIVLGYAVKAAEREDREREQAAGK